MNSANDTAAEYEVTVHGLNYSYTVRLFEATNALGVVTAVLTEYRLSGNAGDSIFLYKTSEGSWYDIKQADSPFKTALIASLKSAIDKLENNSWEPMKEISPR